MSNLFPSYEHGETYERGYRCLAPAQIGPLGYLRGSDKTSYLRGPTCPRFGGGGGGLLMGQDDSGVTHLSAFPCAEGANPISLDSSWENQEQAAEVVQRLPIRLC